MIRTEKLSPQSRTPIDRAELVGTVLREIQTNYRAACLSRVAADYGVSLAYVSECVHEETGKTYKALLQKRRLEVAARLLRVSSMQITEIMSRVGYENSSYFYNLFHAKYGRTPLDYRRAYARARFH